MIPEERREYLIEKTTQKLQTSTEQLQLIDDIQRLGIGYHLEDMIDAILQLQFSAFSTEEDLFTTALRFRLLRQAGFHVSTGTLSTFNIYRFYLLYYWKIDQTKHDKSTHFKSF